MFVIQPRYLKSQNQPSKYFLRELFCLCLDSRTYLENGMFKFVQTFNNWLEFIHMCHFCVSERLCLPARVMN